MSGVEGSSLPQTQLQLKSHHVPQILRPPPNRHFPFSPAPKPPSFDPHIFPDLRGRFAAAAAEKDKIHAPDLPLKQTNKTEDHEANCAERAIKQENKEATGSHMLAPVSNTGAKRHRRPKFSKQKRSLPQTPGATDGDFIGSNNALTPASSCRYDSSLGLLTKKFITLLQQAEDGTLDLNRAADILDVQKRRIYDITNVLEGVGLIEKKLKNRIRWKGLDMSRPRELDDQIAGLKAHIETLYAEECRIDGMIREMQENLRVMTEDEDNQKWLYVTMEDINSLPGFEADTLMAIKAPHGTSLEVPDPDEGVDLPHQRYQILLRSSMGPIDCYLISKHEDRLESANHDQRPAMDLYVEDSCNNKDDSTSLQPTDRDTGGTSELGHCQGTLNIYPDCINTQEFRGGIVRIVPPYVDVDADYWLLSDLGVSITDTWNEYLSYWMNSVCRAASKAVAALCRESQTLNS